MWGPVRRRSSLPGWIELLVNEAADAGAEPGLLELALHISLWIEGCFNSISWQCSVKVIRHDLTWHQEKLKKKHSRLYRLSPGLKLFPSPKTDFRIGCFCFFHTAFKKLNANLRFFCNPLVASLFIRQKLFGPQKS